ncbi:MAG: hypothetical protein AAB412_03125, partial [Elusimicrobiota bacterium]
APQEQQAASTFTATVYAADDFFNPYEPSQGMSPDVWLELSTPYGTAGTTVTLTVGSTNYPVHILAASSNTLVNAKTADASYVLASTRVVVVPNLPTRLQLLLPGQNPLPGSYSGYSGGVLDMVAGTTYWATVNLTDDYYNVEAATSTFVSEAALVYPIVRLILSDPNVGPRGFLPVGEAALIAGARQFSFIPATRTCPACAPSLPKLSAQVVDTQQTSTNYASTTTASINVAPGPAKNLQMLLPGTVNETPSEGSLAGKTGSPGPFTAGNQYQITLRATDNYWNRTADNMQVGLVSNDLYASTPAWSTLIISAGEKVTTIPDAFIPRTATTTATGGPGLVLTLTDEQFFTLATATASGFTVNAKPFAKVMTLLPGETHVPGKPPFDTGVTGGRNSPYPAVSTAVPAGAPMQFTVKAVDQFWNPVSVSSEVGMNSSDALASIPTPILTLAGGVTAFTFTPVQIGNQTVAAAVPGAFAIAASTSNAFSVVGSRLSILAQGETPAPGATGACGAPPCEGRNGTPDGVPGGGPDNFTAGVSFNLTVRLADFWYFPLASGSPVTLRFFSTDPYAQLPPDSTLDADGESTFTASLASATAAGSRIWVEPVGNPNIAVSTSSLLYVDPAGPARILALARGMGLVKGSPSGTTGAAASTVAGRNYPLTLFITDAFYNPVTSISPVLDLRPSDPNVLAVSTNAASGLVTADLFFKTNTVVDPVGGPWSVGVSTADGSNLSSFTVYGITVDPGPAYRFQVLVPTETPKPGNLALAGKSTASATAQYAGSTFSLTVNLVDQFYNRVLPGSNSTFKLKSDDPNHKLGTFGNFNTVNGQFITTHTYLVTQSTAAGWTVTASTATGDAVLPDESARFLVRPSTAAKLVIVMPGQARADGVGMSGNPNTQIAGENIVLTVYAVDAGWNYVPVDQRNLRLRTFTDAFAPSSWTVSMANGVALATVSLRSVGVHSFTVDDQSGVPPSLTGVTSSTFTLVASNPKKLRVLLPSQSGVSGSTTTGRSGIPIDQLAGTTVTVTLQVTDTFWNLTPGASQQIRIVATDPYAIITPSTLTVVGQALVDVVFRRAALNFVRAEMLYENPPWGDSLDKDTSTVVSVLAGLPKNLLVILPGEEFDVGAPNGKRGSPNITAKAGQSFYATVGVVDKYYNVVTGRAANVRVKSPPGFPFAVSAPTAALNVAFGMSDAQALPVTLVAAATWHQVVAE